MNTVASEEFTKIPHCGGHITFSISTRPADGVRLVSFGFRHSRPVPASLFAIWALPPLGIPLAHYPIEQGMGVQHTPPCDGAIPVYIGSDAESMHGNECPNCRSFWRSRSLARLCPYCGVRAARVHFLTHPQRRYIQYCCEKYDKIINECEDGEYSIDMDAAADAAIQAHSLDYYYENESQQTRFSCDQCSSVEDILGELGFCSYCGAFNGKQHVAKRIIVLREKLKAANTPSDVLREAVSIFDATTRKYVENLVRFVPLSRRRRSMFADKSFHDIIRVSQDMRDAFDIDILKDFTRSDQQSLARMFARRHLYEHRGGAVDKIYIDRTGEKTLRIGQVIRDNQGDIQRFLSQLSRIFERMHNGFHELIPHDAKES